MNLFAHLVDVVAGFLIGGVGPIVVAFLVALGVRILDRAWLRWRAGSRSARG